MRVVAVDQGTTSTRALAVDDGVPRLAQAVEHRQSYPREGWVEHDADELVRNILACLDAAGPADAIGLDNQGESCLAWDGETKEAVTPVIVWQDSRTEPAIARLKRDGAEAVTWARAGLPLDSYFTASKLGWILENVPRARELRAAGRLRLGTTDAYFLDRLAGSFATDITTASRTSLMNLRTGAWDDELCGLFGVPMEALPPIRPTTGEFGAVEVHGRRIPVTASVVDQQAALYGHGCRERGDAKITFGTGAFALALSGTEPVPEASDAGLLSTVAWKLDDAPPVFALDGGIYTAAACVNWARALGLFSRFDELAALERPSAIERGIAFVPALSGLACPHWDRAAAGAWLGMRVDTTAPDLMKAILEGVALRAVEVLETIGRHVPLRETVSVDGGMSANPYFCQFLADASGRTVSVPGFGELTALGTALLAGAAPGPVLEEPRCYRPDGRSAEWRARFSAAVAASRSWGAVAGAGE